MLYYRWIQVVHEIPGEWKRIPRKNHVSSTKIYIDYHAITKNLIVSLEKLI